LAAFEAAVVKTLHTFRLLYQTTLSNNPLHLPYARSLDHLVCCRVKRHSDTICAVVHGHRAASRNEKNVQIGFLFKQLLYLRCILPNKLWPCVLLWKIRLVSCQALDLWVDLLHCWMHCMKEGGYGSPSRTTQVARALWCSGYLHTKGPSSEAASSTCIQAVEIIVILLSCRVSNAGTYIRPGSNLQVNSARGLPTGADLRR